MKTPVIRSSEVQRDQARILDYFLEVDAIDAGLRFSKALDETLDKISDFPDLGSPWESPQARLAKTRYWPVKGFENYLVFYQRVTSGVLIKRIFHSSQDIESTL